ncbi:LCP family protein [Vagococcus entomophilus]|uniref:Regulatory protein MsrR n=1 Tax=Vagococcus entomophilus TaxID=1160095 RepID=A0A430AJH4_9ENTE|nr:LCP family protein [Vagococcus entomophilus]RSU08199.1 hypothetical protein CBF30_02850 [Vagococcus entomophilus]
MSRMDRYNQPSVQENQQSMERRQQQSEHHHPPKKKRKKRHLFRNILLLLFLLLLVFGGYSYASYKKGLESAKNDKSIPQIKVDEFNGEASSDGSVNILLLGSDSRGADQGRSDTIMVAHYSKNSKTPKLISFMRDTYVNIPGVGYNKINAAYSYGGPDLVRKTLKNMFGISIQYYAIVNFESFPKVIDTLLPSGVKINAEKDLDLDQVFIKKGWQSMTGKQALQYARFRHDEEGDFGRVRRQQQVMTAIMKQAVSPKSLFTFAEAVGKVQGYTTTDIPNSFYLSVAKDFVIGSVNPLEKMTVPVDDSWSYENYTSVGSVLSIDELKNKLAVQKFVND